MKGLSCQTDHSATHLHAQWQTCIVHKKQAMHPWHPPEEKGQRPAELQLRQEQSARTDDLSNKEPALNPRHREEVLEVPSESVWQIQRPVTAVSLGVPRLHVLQEDPPRALGKEELARHACRAVEEVREEGHEGELATKLLPEVWFGVSSDL
jgi:hypothetical protein